MFYFSALDESSKERLIHLIKQLPDRYKEAVYMAEVEDASPYAIAEKLNLKYNTARTRIQRGRAELLKLIKVPEPSKIFSLGIHFPST
jgi:DNA-directed RNA polymerase specialized sigma24 family protein